MLFWSPSCGFCARILDELKRWEETVTPASPQLVVISTGDPDANRAMGLGKLSPPGTRDRRPIGDRQIAYDLKFISAEFRWATMAGDGAGGVLLDRNPCAGFSMPVEQSPKRPRMSAGRYQAMREFIASPVFVSSRGRTFDRTSR
jgi:hypothetical protein